MPCSPRARTTAGSFSTIVGRLCRKAPRSGTSCRYSLSTTRASGCSPRRTKRGSRMRARSTSRRRRPRTPAQAWGGAACRYFCNGKSSVPRAANANCYRDGVAVTINPHELEPVRDCALDLRWVRDANGCGIEVWGRPRIEGDVIERDRIPIAVEELKICATVLNVLRQPTDRQRYQRGVRIGQNGDDLESVGVVGMDLDALHHDRCNVHVEECGRGAGGGARTLVRIRRHLEV